MKLTLDHNVIIDLAKGSSNIARLRQLLTSGRYQGFVVDIGASEMRQRGIRPDRYDLFEQLLQDAGVSSLPRLTPMKIWDVTFWDRDLWADNAMAARAAKIEYILFGQSQPINLQGEPDDSPKVAAWVNRVCDVQTMWCHLHYGNDIFVTSDGNFKKATKMPHLLSMGAGKICGPDEL